MTTWKVKLVPEAQADFDRLDGSVKKRIRIVYQVINLIIKVIAIDKREDMEVYRVALKRIIAMKSD
ncbi:MAG: hypothetical protein J7M30_16250 [Deltaproteobacteria bacterium]|nr:hypothetical protein [Deltaproteobacteria bacterium]